LQGAGVGFLGSLAAMGAYDSVKIFVLGK